MGLIFFVFLSFFGGLKKIKKQKNFCPYTCHTFLCDIF